MVEILAMFGDGPFTIGAVAVGVVTALLIQGAKKISFVPINSGQRKTIRAVVAVLTFATAFLTAFANGDLQGAEFITYLGTVAEGFVSYTMAYLTYKTGLKNK